MSESAVRSPRALIIAVLALVTVAAYWPVLRNGFICYDDNSYLTDNPVVQNGMTLSGLRWAFTTTTASNWHPLTWLSHMMDWQLFGDWAGGHHLVSLLLHIANAIILFEVLLRMAGMMWRSAMVAALFALHPLHVESVAWAAERKDVLSTLFGFLAIWSYANYAQRRSMMRYGLVLGFFALSLLSKPMLVTLPCLLLLLDFWPLRRMDLPAGEARPHEFFRLFLEKIPLALLSLVSCIMTMRAQRGAVSSIESLPMQERISNAVVSGALYLGKVIWPVDLAVLYPYRSDRPVALVGLAAALLLGISVIAMVMVRKRPWLLIGWLWFLGTLVPVIGLVQVGTQSMADRYTYVPLIGLFIMVAWSIPEVRCTGRLSISKPTGVVIAIILILLGVRTAVQASYWRSSRTLFERTLAITSDNSIAHSNLGHAYATEGRTDDAITQFENSLRINSNYAVAQGNLGVMLLDRGDLEGAVTHLSAAVKLGSRTVQTHNSLSAALIQSGRIDEAIAAARVALRIDPDFAPALTNLGLALTRKGAFDEAIVVLTRATQSDPQLGKAHTVLGMALWGRHRPAEAIVAYERALQLAAGQGGPDIAQTHLNLGKALAQQERVDDAILHFQEALRLQPDLAEARNFLQLAAQQKASRGGQR